MKVILGIFAGLAIAGILLGHFLNPLTYVLYCQLACVLLAVVGLVTAVRFLPSLPFSALFFGASILRKPALALIFLALFLAVLAGRKAVQASPRLQKAVLITAGASGLVLGLSLISFQPALPEAEAADRKARALQSLPYLDHVAVDRYDGRTGVIRSDPGADVSGLNLVNSYYVKGARLYDAAGRVLHAWLPETPATEWQYVALCRNGDLLVCVENAALMRIDWNSRVLWRRPIRVHHDVVETDDGDVLALTRGEETVAPFLVPVPILNDYLEIYSGDGRLKRKISLYDVLKDRISPAHVVKIGRYLLRPRSFRLVFMKRQTAVRKMFRIASPCDVFHSNTITPLDRDLPGLGRKGDVLISVREMNLIGILDMRSEKLAWSWGPGELDAPHHPTITANGRILVFDNGKSRGFSRVLELDPLRKMIDWEYRASPREKFYSSWGGAAQRLENGNTLITITNEGRAIEIDRDGGVVWEFLNPQEGKKKGKRATIYRLTRIPKGHAVFRLLSGPPGAD